MKPFCAWCSKKIKGEKHTICLKANDGSIACLAVHGKCDKEMKGVYTVEIID
jgi:hypothetical protein